jgi:hypothetical protein
MSVLLAMLGAGSIEETKKEIRRTLGIKANIEDETISEGISELMQAMTVSKQYFYIVPFQIPELTHTIYSCLLC